MERFLNPIIQAITEVYNDLGPGHTESVYESALDVELMLRQIPHRKQVPCTLTYKNYVVGTGFIDILISNIQIVECKAINKLTSKEEFQVRKYLQALQLESGLLVNFGPELEIMEVLSGKANRTSRDSERTLLPELHNKGFNSGGYNNSEGFTEGRLGELED